MTISSSCLHKEEGRLCPISKIPCPGECVYADVLENVAVGIVVLDVVQETVIFQNKSAIETFSGLPPKDFRALSAAMGGFKEQTVTKDHPLPRTLPYRDRLLGFTIYNINDVYFWVFALDITERCQAEAERILLSKAVDSAAEAILVLDPEGRIQYLNPAFEETTLFVQEEVLGRPLRKLLRSPDRGEAFFLRRFARMRRGQVLNERIPLYKRDGTLFLAEATAFSVRDGDRIQNYVVFLRDVTERVRLESLAEVVNAMSNLEHTFAGIRHEIGNPINSAKMTLSVLRTNLDRFSRENTEVYLDRALGEIARVEYLLKVLKNFNLFEQPILEDLPLPSFLPMVLSLIETDLQEKGIALRVIHHPEATSVRADPRGLQQILVNLLSNAADALEGVPDPKVILAVFRRGGQIVISITDNGCGFSEEALSRLYRPFFTTKAKGTGLGLILSMKMLAKMNGTIEITSVKDSGTIVDLALPAGAGG